MSFVEDDAAFTLPETIPADVVAVKFDFTNLFDTGVTISSIDANTVEVYGGVGDNTPDTLKDGSPIPSGMIYSQKYTGGVVGTNYLLKMRAIGSDGTKQTISLILPVVAQRLG